jgi:hypothetical protein
VKKRFLLTLSGLILAAGVVPTGQEIAPLPNQASSQPANALTPLRLQVVLSRYSGERKISSIPYTFSVNATPPGVRTTPVSLRMGVEVPVPMTTFAPSADGKSNNPLMSYSYRNVGTNIDCFVVTADGGRFNVSLTVEASAVNSDEAAKKNQRVEQVTGLPPPPILATQPMFTSFKSSLNMLLKDGQTTQYLTATDPVSGDVLKIDVTLNVAK